MSKWDVFATVKAGKYIGQVEAETKEEAEQLAWGLPGASVSVCHQCSRDIEDPEIDKLHAEPAFVDTNK